MSDARVSGIKQRATRAKMGNRSRTSTERVRQWTGDKQDDGGARQGKSRVRDKMGGKHERRTGRGFYRVRSGGAGGRGELERDREEATAEDGE